jgi:hypothetical protein
MHTDQEQKDWNHVNPFNPRLGVCDTAVLLGIQIRPNFAIASLRDLNRSMKG